MLAGVQAANGLVGLLDPPRRAERDQVDLRVGEQLVQAAIGSDRRVQSLCRVAGDGDDARVPGQVRAQLMSVGAKEADVEGLVTRQASSPVCFDRNADAAVIIPSPSALGKAFVRASASMCRGRALCPLIQHRSRRYGAKPLSRCRLLRKSPGLSYLGQQDRLGCDYPDRLQEQSIADQLIIDVHHQASRCNRGV